MLARMLRWALLALLIVGATLGYALTVWAGAPLWSMLALGVGFPFVGTLVAIVFSTITSNAGENAALWWRSVFGEFVSTVKVFWFRQPWSFAAPGVQSATAGPQQIPVVLVHGYLCNHRLWDDMADALRARGHAVLAVNLEPVFTAIDNYSPTVDAAVAALCQQTGSTKVALVGHSMGGLAIRAWLRAQGTQRVARVLTLGTPHAGTRIAPLTNTPNGRQMRWHSQWLSQLTASEPASSRTLVRIALTPQDNIVFPQREQVLPDVVATVFEGIGHLQMCLEPRVIEWVCAQLEGAS